MIDLAIRKTHKYVGTYADLDEWASIGQAEILSQSSQVDEEDICEHTTNTLMVKVTVDDTTTEDDIRQALMASFSHQGCAHEHDCCGCWSRYVSQVDRVNDAWLVTQICSRNY